MLKLNQRILHPAQFDHFDSAKITHPQFIRFIRNEDMSGWVIQGSILAKVGDSLKLKESGSNRIQGYRISSDQKSLVFRDKATIEVMGTTVIELSSDEAQNIEASLSFYDSLPPD